MEWTRRNEMEQTVQTVLEVMQNEGLIQVEVSARHVHLCERSIKVLFGPDAKLTPKRDLSQIGQYLSEERVNLIGPKGRKDKIAVLGPLRKETQVELSKVTVSHWASALRSDSREIRKIPERLRSKDPAVRLRSKKELS